MAEDNRRRPARRGDWKTLPMPETHETFTLTRQFTEAEMAALRFGNVPEAMEDKWFWYMEGDTLWAHRSWTGYCIWHKSVGTDEDLASLNKLLDWWTRAPYDYYHEWLSETYDAIMKAGGKP